MNVLYERCCGIDVHKASIVACLITPDITGTPKKEIRRFSTMTQDLYALRDWLRSEGCTHVAMESTGVYWKPIFNILEGEFEIFVVNARDMKAVPGRKTDMYDAEWIADLLRHGLLKPSLIPTAEQRQLRDLTRYRTCLTQERTRSANRIQKVLEDANIKLAVVATDLNGVSAHDMLDAIVRGEENPDVLASMARGKLKNKHDELVRALEGKVKTHHRFMLAELLTHIDFLDDAISRISKEIEEQLRPFEDLVVLLDTIIGVGRILAQIFLAEFGLMIDHFPSHGHLASWARMCPGQDESAGKRRSGKTEKGNKWLRRALVEAAHAAARSPKSYLAGQYRRIAARRGSKKAAVAVGHSIIVIAYHMLKENKPYHDLGSMYFDERDKARVERRLVKRLNNLGYAVDLKPVLNDQKREVKLKIKTK